MRLRNIWFQLPCFLVAMLMAYYAIWAIIESRLDNRGSSHAISVIGISIFSILALAYLWMALRVGYYQRRIHELTKKNDSPNNRSVDIENSVQPATNDNKAEEEALRERGDTDKRE